MLGGDVRENAALDRNPVFQPKLVDQMQERDNGLHVFRSGVDADDGIAAREQQAVKNTGGDS
jgi:hypothetical protein